MSDNIIRLASVNNTVETDGDAARQMIVAFLREWADAIESGAEDASKAVLTLYCQKDGQFRTRTRRCNVDLLSQVGLMHLALNDVCEGDE